MTYITTMVSKEHILEGMISVKKLKRTMFSVKIIKHIEIIQQHC